jgi:hypothetical protein
MIEELQVKIRRIRPVFILLVLLCPLVAGAQEVSSSGNTGEMPSDALTLGARGVVRLVNTRLLARV